MINLLKIKNLNHLWGSLIVEELVRCGVQHFFIAPGSRSTPLVLGVAENTVAVSHIHYDERGLAYFAMGLTSSTGNPTCIIATSGTAVANFLPAIVEVSKKKIPLIVLTADRPPELRNTGANQTIDQVKIYGDYVRFVFDMPCPTKDICPEMVLTTVDQAVYRSKGNPPGPVHINCMFREPLAPFENKSFSPKTIKSIDRWAEGNLPFTKYITFKKTLTKYDLENIAAEINSIKKGIIAVGKLKTKEEELSVINIAQKLNWPVFPDITSGLRLTEDDIRIIHHFDQILLSQNTVSHFKPDGVLHLGGRITSNRYYNFIRRIKPDKYIMILDHPLRNDPLHNVTLRIESSVELFCNSINSFIKQRKNNTYVSKLKMASNIVSKNIERFTSENNLNSITITHIITIKTPVKTALFLACSMPVRMMDVFADVNENLYLVGANRGASGIDGTIASAVGFAMGTNQPCVLLIGDLAFLHDLNSLALVKSLKQPFVIIVLNDNGGSIFSFLPISSFPHIFEKYFATPHNLSFEMAAKIFDIVYTNPHNKDAFIKEYKKALANNCTTIIELKLNRQENYEIIKSFQDKMSSIIHIK
jgi:2-succinyl-5-enolpyruvyl-6-hydroxy-3-cyclohexene-1-carboxylate synthase